MVLKIFEEIARLTSGCGPSWNEILKESHHNERMGASNCKWDARNHCPPLTTKSVQSQMFHHLFQYTLSVSFDNYLRNSVKLKIKKFKRQLFVSCTTSREFQISRCSKYYKISQNGCHFVFLSRWSKGLSNNAFSSTTTHYRGHLFLLQKRVRCLEQDLYAPFTSNLFVFYYPSPEEIPSCYHFIFFPIANMLKNLC